VKLFSALLVEDDPLVIELARFAVADSFPELELTVLEGAAAALDWLSDNIAKKERMPHIILLDLKLPKLDGLAVLRTMRNYPAIRNIPIVAFSTEYTQEDVLMSYRVGANSFVAKPADHVEFSILLREQLAYWTGDQQHNMPVAAEGDAAGRI